MNPRRYLYLLFVLVLASEVAVAGSADDQYAVAAEHYGRGRWQLAAEEFRTFLNEHTAHPRANAVRFFLAESLIQAGRFAEARSEFRTFLGAAPEHRYARQAAFRIGEAAFLERDSDAAQRSLRQFRANHPHDPLNGYVLSYLGDIALSRDDADEAAKLYGESIERFPNGPLASECRFGLARAAEACGDVAVARSLYRELADDRENSLASDAALSLSMLHYESGEHEAALHLLNRFEVAHPHSRLLVEAEYWRAESLRALGRRTEAEVALRALSDDTENHDLASAVRFALAETLRAGGRGEESIPIYRTVTQRWPESDWADDSLQILVELAFRSDDHAQVKALASQFGEDHPTSSLAPRVRQMMGRSLLKQGKYPAAIEVLEKLKHKLDEAAAVNPLRTGGRSKFERTTAYFLGLAYLGHERFADALTALEISQPLADEQELRGGVLAAKASAFVGMRRFDSALEPLRQYLSEHPGGSDSLECRGQLVRVLAETGDFDAAEEELQRLSQEGLDQDTCWGAADYLANAALDAGRSKLADRLLRSLSDPSAPAAVRKTALARLGQLQMKTNEVAEAADTLAALRSMVRSGPDSSNAALRHGRALQRLKRFAEAIKAYQEVVESDPKSGQAADALLAAAQLHTQLQQYAESRDLLEQILADHPESPQRDAALYLLAWAWTDLGQMDEADRVFQQLVDEHPDSTYRPDALFRLAQARHQRGDLAEATQLIDHLLQMDCEREIRAHALYLSGQMAAQQNDWSDVREPLDQLVEEFPNSPLRAQAVYWRAEASFRQEQWDDALAQFEELAADERTRESDWAAMVSLRQAQIHAQLKNWQSAQEFASVTQKAFPNFAQQFEVDYLMGRVLAAQARFSEARDAYQRVIDSPHGGRSETAAKAQWMIGESYFHQKDFTQAIKAYHRVESLYDYPSWQAAALLQAAKCQELKNNWTEAARLYGQLLEEFPDSDFAREASDRVKTTRRIPVNQMRK